MGEIVEEYKDIIDYEDAYQISNFGNVRNNKTGRILKPTEGKTDKYYYITLCKDGKQKNTKIHRLVAEYFVENPENKQYVDHIDNNKLNNLCSNLRWATKQENNRNKIIYSNNTSGFKGVVFDKQYNKWQARTRVDGKSICFGCFDKIEDAVEARVKGVNKIFGEFTQNDEKI
jgi:hypothetical protein